MWREKNYRPLEVPLKSDGRRFELDNLLEDQRQIMTVILCKLREWLPHLNIEDDCEICHFKPLRMPIMGAAGTGKSVLINTLVTMLRVMFDDNHVVHVALLQQEQQHSMWEVKLYIKCSQLW
jgi:predicted GTPase